VRPCSASGGRLPLAGTGISRARFVKKVLNRAQPIVAALRDASRNGYSAPK
jgi:hypothetical protein